MTAQPGAGTQYDLGRYLGLRRGALSYGPPGHPQGHCGRGEVLDLCPGMV
jgi:hypothetical protein